MTTFLQALRDLDEKATSAPWKVFAGGKHTKPSISSESGSVCVLSSRVKSLHANERTHEVAVKDSELIALLRNNCAAIIALVEAANVHICDPTLDCAICQALSRLQVSES